MATIAALEQLADAPDALRRFVDANVVRASKGWTIRSNSAALADLIERQWSEELLREGISVTVLSDPDLPEALSEPIAMDLPGVVVVVFGRAASFVYDKERLEITGFVSSRVSQQVVFDYILPAARSVFRHAADGALK